jgi:pimeloyl-ACP methyl ester carboxylesterase
MVLRRSQVTRIALALFLLGCLAVAALTGCTALMPHEIRVVERRAQVEADKLREERPAAFQTVVVGNRPLHYVEVTDNEVKPLVLFVHGSPGDWTAWVQYLNDPELRHRAHLVSVDRPGFGGSGEGQVERSLQRQSEDISVLLKKTVPGQRIVVVGHSYGGPVVARLMMNADNHITDGIILAGAIDPDQEKTKWYQYPADWAPLTWLLPNSLVVANREIRALKSELTSMLPYWKEVTQRVSVIQGGKDDLVSPENADFAARMLTHASSVNIIRIPEMNHFLPWYQYDLVKAEILKHLE